MYNKMEKPLPDGWALDKDGHASTDAPDVLANIVAKKGGGIMPLGGSEEVTGSHKGYGYGMLCELFSSILSMGVTSDSCCTFPTKPESAMALWLLIRQHSVIRQPSENIFPTTLRP